MSKTRQSGLGAIEPSGIRSLAVRLPPGHTIGAHAHGWSQIVFASRGALSVEAGARRWVVPPLRCLWVPAGVVHAVATIGETWVRTVYVRPDLAPSAPAGIGVFEVSPLLREALVEVTRIGVLDDADAVHRALGTVVIGLMVRADPVGVELPLPVDPRARRVADRVIGAPGARASVALVSRGCGASPRTIERVFRAETGMSVGRWRQQARIQHAVRRLAEGASVVRTAQECGYDSVSAFVAMFRRALGETPGRYTVRGRDAEARDA
jgi:AraC-like DNA-binding protein/quercetin dioxygenase-like cupin family protein